MAYRSFHRLTLLTMLGIHSMESLHVRTINVLLYIFAYNTTDIFLHTSEIFLCTFDTAYLRMTFNLGNLIFR